MILTSLRRSKPSSRRGPPNNLGMADPVTASKTDKAFAEPADSSNVSLASQNSAALNLVPAITPSEGQPTQASVLQSIADSKLPPDYTAQRIEIQLHNPPLPDTGHLEAKVVFPWVLAFVGWGVAIILHIQGRRNKISDDFNALVTADVKEFLEKIEELSRNVASHQSGCPCLGTDLKESRKHLTELRQKAMAIFNRIDKARCCESDREQWKMNFRAWKAATEGNTDWISNKTRKWTRDQMAILDEANSTYTGQITAFRNRIATRKVRLK